MSELTAFVQLGFNHITDPNGLDHILFLLVLAVIYRLRDWRKVLVVVTAFTIGHSVTLGLAVTGLITFPSALIEFLIPVTIVATGIENLMVRDRAHSSWRDRYRPVLAGVFGLVHGAGFANYLRSMFVEEIAIPLLGFNIGLEVGQIAVLGLTGLLFLGLDALLERVRTALKLGNRSPLQLRVVLVSSVVTVVASAWALDRSLW
jgi:hypothetical protein